MYRAFITPYAAKKKAVVTIGQGMFKFSTNTFKITHIRRNNRFKSSHKIQNWDMMTIVKLIQIRITKYHFFCTFAIV